MIEGDISQKETQGLPGCAWKNTKQISSLDWVLGITSLKHVFINLRERKGERKRYNNVREKH